MTSSRTFGGAAPTLENAFGYGAVDDSLPEDVSRSYRAEVERSVELVLERCLPRLSELASADA